MRELRQRLRLAQQPLRAASLPLGARSRPQQLERDLAVELGIVRGVHDAHAAGAELPHHVAAGPRARR